jgi:hypothetical protein
MAKNRFFAQAGLLSDQTKGLADHSPPGGSSVNDVPPEIFQKRNGSIRMFGWMLLAVILVVIVALYFFGLMPHQAAHPAA